MSGGLQFATVWPYFQPTCSVCSWAFATDGSNTWQHCFPGRRNCSGIFSVGLNFRALKVVAIWDKWLKLMSQLEPEVRVLCPLVVHSGSFRAVAQLLSDFLCHLRPWVLELLFMLTCCSTRISAVWLRLCLQNGLYWRDGSWLLEKCISRLGWVSIGFFMMPL